MLKKVEPLREELRSLEGQAGENEQKGEETKALIAQLEKSIAAYKEEYAQLIQEGLAIKADLDNVQAKVTHSLPSTIRATSIKFIFLVIFEVLT